MIYVDNAATTRMSDEAVNAMLPYLTEKFGNPSSIYSLGRNAAGELEAMRESVAASLGCTAKEVYFTSGGSEADNWAIVSAAKFGAKKGKKHIISTVFEHHAVLHALQKLERNGYEVTYLPVDKQGLISPEQVKNAIRSDTALVTIMYANNEIGTVMPISEIGSICREAGVLFHTDAVQAAGHIKIDMHAQKIDMLSISSHKFHGPKGVGALCVRRGIILENLIEGGGQERGKRAGTENLGGIAAMAEALKIAVSKIDSESERLVKMRNRLIDSILSAIPYSRLNGDRDMRMPGNANFSFYGVEGESLLLLLDMNGICASSGSA
ncbi:MAG: cysteine desulfurase, partial [Clostridiales bacterium]|nr:cysteine desulfurase [Clostridiales bacterium]